LVGTSNLYFLPFLSSYSYHIFNSGIEESISAFVMKTTSIFLLIKTELASTASKYPTSLGLFVVAPNSFDNFLYSSANFVSNLVGKNHHHTLDFIALKTTILVSIEGRFSHDNIPFTEVSEDVQKGYIPPSMLNIED
jgi:hypothetical protein